MSLHAEPNSIPALGKTQEQALAWRDLNPVRFLDPELLRACQACLPFRAGSGYKQHRKFVDGQRHQLFRYIDAF